MLMCVYWDIVGQGEWYDNIIRLISLFIGFDQLYYGVMIVILLRLVLNKFIVWVCDVIMLLLQGVLFLEVGKIVFISGSVLLFFIINFSVEGCELILFQFKGDFWVGVIGLVWLNGCWDGECFCGQVWWLKQLFIVFQLLFLLDWKMMLCEGLLYVQVVFFVVQGQGFEVGGYGVLKGGSVWMLDNKINGVDFILLFCFYNGVW